MSVYTAHRIIALYRAQVKLKTFFKNLFQYTTKSHIAFSAYEACCFQTRDLFDAIAKEEGSHKLEFLRVDGGMTNSTIMLQRQADLLEVPVERPAMSETTALGAALASAVGVGIIKPEEIK